MAHMEGSNSSPSKVQKIAMPEQPPAQWLSAIQSTVSSTIVAELQPLKTQINDLSLSQAKADKRLVSLEERMTKMEARPNVTASNASTIADADSKSRIEVKGWCKHDQRSTHGYTRLQAVHLLDRLRAGVPTELHSRITGPLLSGSRNTSMLVEVDGDISSEVLGCFKDTLEAYNTENDLELWTRIELPKWRRDANGIVGRCMRFVESKLGSNIKSVDPFWYPDFAVGVTSPDGKSQIIMRLDESYKTPVWQPEAPQLLGLSNKGDLADAFKLFGRK
eukprot:TRINITY_DN37266_c0_g1_i1.p2 TRINITY_DN37266_c0_g1~~TRINITY_DN37266_c0_g1_i1.p2  ORF type:complete len:277 (+),score=42.20 TRINITY_DN37266_c0_g1_i1:118-948(+)